MNIESWILFCTTCLIASMTPGPSIVAVVKESASKGLKRTMPMIIGVLAGLLFLAVSAGFGLSVVLEKSKILFTILRYIGGIYLFYLGIQAFFFSSGKVDCEDNSQRNGSLFFKGLGLTLSNPKAIAYFSALFIPFINQNGSFILQLSILIITMIGCSITALLFYGVISEKANGFMRKYSKAFNRLTGSAFMGFSILIFAKDYK